MELELELDDHVLDVLHFTYVQLGLNFSWFKFWGDLSGAFIAGRFARTYNAEWHAMFYDY